jgi:hypothetical protein
MTRAEYQTKYGTPPQVSATPVPVQMTHAEYMAKYGGQTTPTPNLLVPVPESLKGSTFGSNLKSFPGQLFNAAKTLLTGNTGEELAAGAGAGQAADNNIAQINQEHTNLQMAIQARNKLNAAGHDTTHADQMIADMVKGGLGKGSTVADVLPHSQDTNTEALGNVATVGGGILGAGTYGKAAAAMKTATLGTPLLKTPTLITAAKDSIQSDLQAHTAAFAERAASKPFDSALSRIVPDYAASTPAQKGKLIGEAVAGAPRVNEGGLIASRSVNPTALEKEAATELSKIPGYSPKATNLDTYTQVQNEIAARGKNLATSLKAEGVLAPKREVVNVVSKAVTAVPQDSLLLQKSDPIINNYLRVVNNAAAQSDGTLAGVLDVRKALDTTFVNARGKLAFDSEKAVALDEVHGAARDALNQYLIDHAQATDVKAALRSQWNLYRARDAILPKAVKEGVSALDRVKQTIRAHPLGAVITSGAAALGADKILKATTGVGL